MHQMLVPNRSATSRTFAPAASACNASTTCASSSRLELRGS